MLTKSDVGGRSSMASLFLPLSIFLFRSFVIFFDIVVVSIDFRINSLIHCNFWFAQIYAFGKQIHMIIINDKPKKTKTRKRKRMSEKKVISLRQHINKIIFFG